MALAFRDILSQVYLEGQSPISVEPMVITLQLVSPFPCLLLFPRHSSENSVKSAGSRSGKRTRPLGSSTVPSGGGTVTSGRGRGGGNGELGWGASVTSVLTESSAFPTTTLGKFHDASSSVGIVGPLPRQGEGEREETEVEIRAFSKKHSIDRCTLLMYKQLYVCGVVCFDVSPCRAYVCVSNRQNKQH